MLALTLSAYPVTVIAVVAVVFALIIARALKHDSGIRVARLGVFVERRRYVDPDVVLDDEREVVLDDEREERLWPEDPTLRIERPPPE